MNTRECVELRIAVRPSPETNDHEARLLGNGESLVDRLSSGLIGLDPDDLLTDTTCPLRAESESHRATIGRCSCGIIGCGSVEVEIRREHDQVVWTAMDSSLQVRFLAAQYDGEVERALQDRTWETPERTAARLVSRAVDRAALARRGFEFSWASERCRNGLMTVSLVLTPGPYQVLISVPWDSESIEGIVAQFREILSQPPQNMGEGGMQPPSEGARTTINHWSRLE
jgi:hypothetical protein